MPPAQCTSIVRPKPRCFRADPDIALGEYEEPILLDEWQEVLSVLGAVKRAVDRNPRPGSVRADLETATWPGTGRVVRVPMYGMRVRELNGAVDGPSLFDRLAGGGLPSVPSNPPDLRDYVELALRSGFPDPALLMTPPARTRWLEGYVDQLLTRDAAALRLDAGAVLRDGDLLGRLLDTFVAAQLRAEEAVGEARPRLCHLREEHGRHEVDVLAEIGGRDVLAFEVKANAAPDRGAARHLAWLRDRLGERFLGGVVLHTGPASFELDERIAAAPICAIWS